MDGEPDFYAKEEEVSVTIISQSTGQQGRPPIPEKWTRVISLEQTDLENLKTHILATDLLLVQGFQPPQADDPEE